MITKIEVIQEDIDKGNPGSSCNCPLARAIQRHWTFGSVRVGIGGVVLETPTWIFERRMPTECIEFMLDFDAAKTVKPFTFEMDL